MYSLSNSLTRNVIPLLLLISCLDISLGQDFQYTVTEQTFLSAKAAKLYPQPDGVLLAVTDLDPKAKKGVELTFQGLKEEAIEVSRLIKFQGVDLGVFPPMTLLPTDGVYLLLGNPGDRFGVTARTETGIQRILVELSGTPVDPVDPEEPPPSGNLTQEDLDAVTSLTSSSLSSLQDPITARYITAELNKLSLSEVLGEAAVELKKAIGDGLVASMKEVRPPYKDWETNFRKPLDNRITQLVTAGKVVTGADLQLIVKAMLKAMTTSTSSLTATIKMYYSQNCNECSRWEREVYPGLQSVGWFLQKIEDPNRTVPRFVICDNNKCSKEVVGYMDMATFRLRLGDVK